MTRIRLGRSAASRHERPNLAHACRLGPASLVVLSALALTGCGRIGLNDPLAERTTQTAYEPLPAAPTAPVTSTALPPPPPVAAPTVQAGTAVDPAQPAPSGQPTAGASAGIPVASATPLKPAEPVAVDKAGPTLGRGDLAGAWRISTGADNCQLFLTTTSWSGGSRASTKGCNSAEMQKISAWEIVGGKQVALKGNDGTIVATLTSAGQQKFVGTTASKQSISLSINP